MKIFFFLILVFLAVSTVDGQSGFVSIGLTDSIHSVYLNEERKINISLPQGYNPDSAERYPVIYLLDGGADEDFVHVVGLVQFCSRSWVQRIPPSIVVGIQNVNRQRDFTFPVSNTDFISRKTPFKASDFRNYGGSAAFIRFIGEELQPYIGNRYKVAPDRTIIGESLAGLLVSEILMKNPAMFEKYIIVSPSLWWGNEALIKDKTILSASGHSQTIQVFIAAAKKSEDSVMFQDAKNFYLYLRGFSNNNIRLRFDYLQNETHATILHQAVYDALMKTD